MPPCFVFSFDPIAAAPFLLAQVTALCWGKDVSPELGHRDGETPEQRAALAEAAIASRVPDISFLLECVLTQAAQTRACRNRGAQLRRLDSACLSGRSASNRGGCGACARRKFESKAGDSASEAGVQVGPRRSDSPSGGGQRRLASDRRPVRDLRKNTCRETHGDSPPRRPHALHG